MWVVHLVVTVLCAGLGDASSFFHLQRVPNLDGYLPASGFLVHRMTRTRAGCAVFCMGVSGCRSFFHVEDGGFCQCHSGVFNETFIPSLPENATASYYEKQGTPLACPDDDLTFTLIVLRDGTTFQYRFLLDMKRDYNESVAQCEAEGSSLIQLLDLPKFNTMVQLMSKCPAYQFDQKFVVDGGLNLTTGTWHTREGRALPMTPSFWSPGQPDNGSGDEYCIGMVPAAAYKWRDRPCSGTGYALCEKP